MNDKKLPVRIDPERLSRPAERALNAISGKRVMLEYVCDDRIPSGRRYTLQPDGRRIPNEDFEELCRKGKLAPLNDGLFEGQSQQWVRA